MIYFSFPAVINSILYSTILVFVIYLMCKNFKTIQAVGVPTLIFSIILLTLRLFIPFEFGFTREILSTDVYTKIDAILNKELLVFGDLSIRIVQVLFVIWFGGIFFNIFKILYGHVKLAKLFNSIREDNSASIQLVKERFKSNFQVNLKIIRSDIVSSPIIYGLTKPVIVLPYDNFSENQLYYYILHELEHFKNKDLWLKLIFELLCSVFWFYPPISVVFKKLYVNIMEFRVDLQISSCLSEKYRIEYLESILTVSKSHLNKISPDYSIGLLGNSKDDKVITKRFSLVLGMQEAKQSIFAKICGYTFSLSLFILSFVYVVQPHYIQPSIEKSTFDINDFSYIEKYSDSEYALFNEKKERIAVLEEIPDIFKNLPIYKYESDE